MSDPLALSPESWLSPDGIPSTLKLVLLITAVSIVPSLLLMTTCFVRMAVVLGLLKHALGAQQFLPNQVMTGLSVFLTLTVMWPVWQQSYERGIRPYAEAEFPDEAAQRAAFTQAAQQAWIPLRDFMSTQIEMCGNEAAIDLFASYQSPESEAETLPQYYEDVPVSVLLPAYVLSELKTAFLIGFQICLPFLVIDLVTASLLAGLGLNTLAPATVALPCKLLLFVMADGWFLTVQVLLDSIGPMTG